MGILACDVRKAHQCLRGGSIALTCQDASDLAIRYCTHQCCAGLSKLDLARTLLAPAMLVGDESTEDVGWCRRLPLAGAQHTQLPSKSLASSVANPNCQARTQCN
mmetsp:Transcript_16252/g.56717  ORF Transcript_16252/g.56717 Transcript_16252/m.56717 type:complete len:105 (-) Transcript_16252:478-792(-)